MKKRWLLYVIFGLVFYLLFLVIEMPASWFAWALNKFTQGTIRVEPITGSLWHGTGRLVIYFPQTTPHDLGTADWRINPFWLFAGRMQMNWQSNTQGSRINTTIRLSSGKVELLDTEASFPAQSVGGFYPAAALISPQGQVRLHIDKLTMDHNGMVGGGDILWHGAGSSLTAVQPLGDYHLQIAGAGKTADLRLSTQSGALELMGRGQWQLLNGQVQLIGSALPRDRAAELEPLLRLFGEDQGNGRRPLALNSRLPFAFPFTENIAK